MSAAKIFRKGKNTFTRLSFEGGVAKSIITHPGQGCFLEADFSTVPEAVSFAQAELRKNPSEIFYVIADGLIAETVMDLEFQKEKQRRSQRNYASISTGFFCLVGFLMALASFPNHTFVMHLGFSLGVGISYLLLHNFMGKGNVEGAVVMSILLVLLGIILNISHHAKKATPSPIDQTSGSGSH